MKSFNILFLLLILNSVYAQDTIYYSVNNVEIDSRDNASYYCLKYKTSATSFNAIEYYMTDSIKGKGSYIIKNGKELRHGVFTTYNTEGIESSKATFRNGSCLESYSITEKYNGATVYFVADTMPEYPGGQLALRMFIAEHVEYPELARQNEVQGRVYVNFIVDKRGKVNNLNIVRGVDPSLDKAAMQVISELPNFKPAKHNGEYVNISYTVPINFLLSGVKDKTPKIKFGKAGILHSLSENKSGKKVKITKKTSTIIISELGANDGFGVFYSLVVPKTEATLFWKVISPPLNDPRKEEPVTSQTYRYDVVPGEEYSVKYNFDYEWEKVPGEWIFEFYYNEKLIGSKSYIVKL